MLTDEEKREIWDSIPNNYTNFKGYADAIERAVLAKAGEQEPIGLQYRYLDHSTKQWGEWGDKIKGKTGGYQTRNLYAHSPQSAIPPEWREAVQEFVDRVERGEVRSKRTYEKFKQLLEPK